jgi:hypothetical protein
MSTVVVEERGSLGHANSVSYDALSCGRGLIRNCISRGQHVKRGKRRLTLYSTAGRNWLFSRRMFLIRSYRKILHKAGTSLTFCMHPGSTA